MKMVKRYPLDSASMEGTRLLVVNVPVDFLYKQLSSLCGGHFGFRPQNEREEVKLQQA